jgi:hypothetical protein
MAEEDPTAPPTLNAVELEEGPLLDGDVLGDAAWSGRNPATGFTQTKPDEGESATQRTEVFVGFTEDTLYIGAVMYDDEPSKIIIADSRRDSSLTDTDSFQVVFDTYNDKQNGLVFGTNAAGIEYDGQVTREGSGGRSRSGSSGFNLNWDTSWTVVSKVSEIGWSTEIAIPFKSLRYGAGDVQSWGINFQRNIRRNNEQSYWAPLPRQYNLYRVSQAGVLSELGVPPQRNLKLTPYVLGKYSHGGPDSDGMGTEGSDFEEEIGFDLKYSVTPSLTLDVTVNTDFAQVEADELQVNLDRFSLFFEEKRPFFLENAGQFQLGDPQEVQMFFSRRIGIGAGGAQTPIDGGIRLTGKVGQKTNIGVLHMRSEAVTDAAPQNDFTVMRVNQELKNRSSIGFMAVNREGDGSYLLDDDDDYNRTYAVDGRWGVSDNTTVSGWAAMTDTPDLSNSNHALGVSVRQTSEKWFNTLSYTEVANNFNPEVGFLSRKSYRKIRGMLFRRIRPNDFWGLQEVRPHISVTNHYSYEDGFHESTFAHVDNHWEWKNGIEVHTGVNFTHEGVRTPFEIVEGIMIPAGSYDHEEADLVFMTDESKPVSLNLETKIGGRFGGDRISVDPEVTYRVGEKFTGELGWSYNDFDLPQGDFEVNVGRLRATYSFTPKLSLQALLQYDDRDDVVATNLRFAWLRTANTGLYVVYNELDDQDFGGDPRREFIVKYSRQFDLLR